MILKDIKGLNEAPDAFERELLTIQRELKVLAIKDKLKVLATKIHSHEKGNKKGDMHQLQEKFGALTKKLQNLEEKIS
jgi:hypothetical protein